MADQLCMERMRCGQTFFQHSHDAFQKAVNTPELLKKPMCIPVSDEIKWPTRWCCSSQRMAGNQRVGSQSLSVRLYLLDPVFQIQNLSLTG